MSLDRLQGAHREEKMVSEDGPAANLERGPQKQAQGLVSHVVGIDSARKRRSSQGMPPEPTDPATNNGVLWSRRAVVLMAIAGLGFRSIRQQTYPGKGGEAKVMEVIQDELVLGGAAERVKRKAA